MAKPINQFEETARWGEEWHRTDDWAPHTVTAKEAAKLAAGYVHIMRVASGRKLHSGLCGLGIGSGAGYLEAALTKYNIRMVASEWNKEGLQLIAGQNPDIERRQVDLLNFFDNNMWDLILCRELYPFTRTNAFSKQMETLSRLIDALKPGGILLLVGSDASYPYCLDYRLMHRYIKADPRITKVFGPISEILAKRTRNIRVNGAGYRFLNMIFEAVFFAIKKLGVRSLASIRIYAMVKAN